MEICILASSSAGNATAIRAGTRIVLLDAGLSGRVIEQRLVAVGWSPADLAAVVLSHEHTDHVRGAGVIARRYCVPVYGTPGTLEASKAHWRGSEDLRSFEVGRPFHVADLRFEPFSVPHDVADPAQFVIHSDRTSLGVATDLGRVTALVKRKLSSADCAIIEANHDAERLLWGDYPWELKQRIASKHGHLDNDQAAGLAVSLVKNGVRHIVFAHLSPHHNDAEQVRTTMTAALAAAGLSAHMTIVPPGEGTGIISVGSPETAL